MIQTHSDDPDVEAAAREAAAIVKDVLVNMPPAKTFDYGGHDLGLNEYNVCLDCTKPIAEAQQASQKLFETSETVDDETVKEHVDMAGELLRLEARAAEIRAQFHNGHGSEPILNVLLGFVYERDIHDTYDHSHEAGKINANG